MIITKQVTKQVVLRTNDNNLIADKLPKPIISIDKVEDFDQVGKAFIKRVTFTTYSDLPYEDLVHKLVREKYSESEEFAILRKAIRGNKAEYNTYNDYVEECKVRAKQFIQERNKVLGE